MNNAAPIIRPNGCKNRKSGAPGQFGLTCHLLPPTSHPVFAADKPSGRKGPLIGVVTLWPTVQPDWQCRHWEPGLAMPDGAVASPRIASK